MDYSIYSVVELHNAFNALKKISEEKKLDFQEYILAISAELEKRELNLLIAKQSTKKSKSKSL